MHMVDGHLVHAVEVGQRVVEHVQGERRAGQAGIGLARPRAFGVGQDGLEALPVGEGTQGGVGADQVVQMGGAGPGQPADDDGPHDPDVVDLRMTGQHVLDEQTVLEQLDQLAVPATMPGA